MTSGRIFQGLGRGIPSLVITGLRVLIVGVPGAYAAVYLFGAPIQAVWASFVAGGVVANDVSLVWIRKVIWSGDPSARAVDPQASGSGGSSARLNGGSPSRA